MSFKGLLLGLCFAGAPAAIALASGGCSVTKHAQLVSPGGPTFQRVSPESVKIYAGESPHPPRAIIGPLAVDELGGGDSAVVALRRDAAEAGADAVIHLRLTKTTGYVPRTGVSGIAVRLNP